MITIHIGDFNPPMTGSDGLSWGHFSHFNSQTQVALYAGYIRHEFGQSVATSNGR